MQPCLLRIRKKTLFPSKHQIIHKWRSSWITVGAITPVQSLELLSQMKWDSNFAKFIKDNWGIGIYSVLIFKKGVEGFRSFMKVECKEDSYIRLRKEQSEEEKERIQLKFEGRRINRQLKEKNKELPEEKKEMLKDELDTINSLVDIYSVESSSGSGCYPYLKTLVPLFKEHNYSEEYRERPIPIKRAKIIREENNTNNFQEEVVGNPAGGFF